MQIVAPGRATLLAIDQGSAVYHRNGNKCTVTNIDMRLNFRYGHIMTTSSNYVLKPSPVRVRVVFAKDKACNGVATPWSNLFVKPDNANGTSVSAFDFRNMSTVDRYQILADKSFKLDVKFVPTTDSNGKIVAQQFDSKLLKMSFKLRDSAQFAGATGDLSALRNLNYLAFISKEASLYPPASFDDSFTIFQFQPFSSAHLSYICASSHAKSEASSPPAPARTSSTISFGNSSSLS